MLEEEEKLRSPKEADVNEVFVRSTPRPMSTGQRSRSEELLPPFESKHYDYVSISCYLMKIIALCSSKELALLTLP